MDRDIEFGAWSRWVRERQRYSQGDVARMMDFAQTMVSRIERGELEPSAEYVIRFAKVMHIGLVDALKKAGIVDEQTVAGDELAELGRLLAHIPDSERPRILHSLETMLKDLGESYVASESDPAGDAADPDEGPARADP